MNNNSTAVSNVIPFRSNKLLLVEHDGQPFVPMKPVVDGMGLDWKSQHLKLQSGRFNSVMVMITTTGADGKRYEMSCLPLRKLAGWLMSIQASKVRAELRDSVIAYQNECDDVLWSYWNDGHAANEHPIGHGLTLIGQTIGTDGFHILGSIIKGKVSSLPAASRRRAIAKIWSQTHAAFGVRSAEDIPAEQLDSARNFISAYVLDGELLHQDLPASPHFEIPNSSSLIQRWLVGFDGSGNQKIKPIPNDAFVMSAPDFFKRINAADALYLTPPELIDFVIATMSHLKQQIRA